MKSQTHPTPKESSIKQRSSTEAGQNPTTHDVRMPIKLRRNRILIPIHDLIEVITLPPNSISVLINIACSAEA